MIMTIIITYVCAWGSDVPRFSHCSISISSLRIWNQTEVWRTLQSTQTIVIICSEERRIWTNKRLSCSTVWWRQTGLRNDVASEGRAGRRSNVVEGQRERPGVEPKHSHQTQILDAQRQKGMYKHMHGCQCHRPIYPEFGIEQWTWITDRYQNTLWDLHVQESLYWLAFLSCAHSHILT